MSTENEAPKSNAQGVASLPKEWPGAFEVYKLSKSFVEFNMNTLVSLVGILLGAWIVYYILLIILPHSLAFVIEIIYDLVSVLVSSTVFYAALKSVRGVKISVSEVYSDVLEKWFNLIITSIICGVLVLISIVLLVIPVFFIAPRLVLAIYYVLDQNKSPVEAVQASWENTRGNVGKIYGLIGLTILIILPSITIIGILATIYFGFMFCAAYAILYCWILKNQPTAQK